MVDREHKSLVINAPTGALARDRADAAETWALARDRWLGGSPEATRPSLLAGYNAAQAEGLVT